MALLIPKLRWQVSNIEFDTTSGSDEISSQIEDWSLIEAGQTIECDDFPEGTTVVSNVLTNPSAGVDLYTVTLSDVATASTSAQTATVFTEYEFEYPPENNGDTEWVSEAQNNVSTSLSGIRQVVSYYTERTRSLRFAFVSSADADILENGFFQWAKTGQEFLYYPDKDETEVYTCELDNFKFSKNREVKKHPNFLYKIAMVLREVVS